MHQSFNQPTNTGENHNLLTIDQALAGQETNSIGLFCELAKFNSRATTALNALLRLCWGESDFSVSNATIGRIICQAERNRRTTKSELSDKDYFKQIGQRHLKELRKHLVYSGIPLTEIEITQGYKQLNPDGTESYISTEYKLPLLRKIVEWQRNLNLELDLESLSYEERRKLGTKKLKELIFSDFPQLRNLKAKLTKEASTVKNDFGFDSYQGNKHLGRASKHANNAFTAAAAFQNEARENENISKPLIPILLTRLSSFIPVSEIAATLITQIGKERFLLEVQKALETLEARETETTSNQFDTLIYNHREREYIGASNLIPPLVDNSEYTEKDNSPPCDYVSSIPQVEVEDNFIMPSLPAKTIPVSIISYPSDDFSDRGLREARTTLNTVKEYQLIQLRDLANLLSRDVPVLTALAVPTKQSVKALAGSYSLAYFRDGKRNKDNVATGCLVYDLDCCNVNAVMESINALDIQFIMHSTYNDFYRKLSSDNDTEVIYDESERHQRLIIPLSRLVTSSEYDILWSKIAKSLDIKPDLGAKDAARVNFFPACRTQQDLERYFLQGLYIEDREDLEFLDPDQFDLTVTSQPVLVERLPVSQDMPVKASVGAMLPTGDWQGHYDRLLANAPLKANSKDKDYSRTDMALVQALFFKGYDDSFIRDQLNRAIQRYGRKKHSGYVDLTINAAYKHRGFVS